MSARPPLSGGKPQGKIKVSHFIELENYLPFCVRLSVPDDKLTFQLQSLRFRHKLTAVTMILHRYYSKYSKFSVSLLVIVQKVVGKTAKKVCAVGMIPVELVEETEIYVWFFAFPVERDADVMTLAPVL